MKNVCVVAVLAAALAGSTLVSASAEPASKAAIKNVVLVHGAFADGSGWKAVAEILEKDGYTVSVAQPPETSYADDQKYTNAALVAHGIQLFTRAAPSARPRASGDPELDSRLRGNDRFVLHDDAQFPSKLGFCLATKAW